MLWLAALVVWSCTAVMTAPPHFMYRVAFMVVAASVGVMTYWWPGVGWQCAVALIPVANLPSRAAALGAHEALVFVALACALGWWANRLVTRLPTHMPAGVMVASMMVMSVVMSSGVWTALRYADFSVVTGEPFRNVWVNTTGALDAATAIRIVILATLREMVLPALVWVSHGVVREDDELCARRWPRVMVLWGMALLPVLGVVVYQSHFNPGFCMLREVAWTESGRVSGGMSDPNALGIFLFVALPMMANMAWEARGLAQMWYMVLVVSSVYALGQSGSRSGLVGTFVVGAVAGGLSMGRLLRRGEAGRRLFAAGAGMVMVAVCLAASVVLAPLGEGTQTMPLVRRLQGFATRLQSGAGTSVVDRREVQWQQAVAMARRYPVTGVGVGAFAIELPNLHREAVTETPIDNAWNQYLQWLAELGIVGLGLWIWWIGAYVGAVGCGQARQRNRNDAVALLTLAVFAVLCMVGAHLQAAEVACGVAVLCGLALAGARPGGGVTRGVMRSDVVTLGCIVVLMCISQAHYAARLLARAEQQRRYGLPKEFGWYHTEDWYGQFTYQWAQRYAGRMVMVPERERVMVLRLAAFDPDISPEWPKRVNVRINGVLMDTLAVTDNRWNEYEVYVYDTATGAAELTLECDRVWRPPHETPPRALGVAVATEIGWRAELRREGQGLSEWYEDSAHTPAVAYRWTGARAARMMTVGTNGIIRLRVRTPVTVSFYRDAPRVIVRFNNAYVSEFALPRRADEWREETVMKDAGRAGQRGILSVHVSRLSRVRMKGSVRRRLVGMGLAEIETE